MYSKVFLSILLSVQTCFLHSSQLEPDAQKSELYYYCNQKWPISVVSLEKHIGDGEKVSSLCFDQTGKGLLIGVGKKVLFFNKQAKVLKPYEFNYLVHSVSLDSGLGYFFVSKKMDDSGTVGHELGSVEAYSLGGDLIDKIDEKLANLIDIGKHNFTLNAVHDGMLVISCEDNTFLYDIDYNKIIDHQQHPPYVQENGKKLLRGLSSKPIRNGEDYILNPLCFSSKEGVVCTHSTDDVYPFICAYSRYGRYGVKVTKCIISDNKTKQGKRFIPASGELSDIVRSPVNPEMFMLVYKDEGKGIELQHVEGPSRCIRTCSNIHGPFSFSPDGTEFVGFNRSDLIVLTIAERTDFQKTRVADRVQREIRRREIIQQSIVQYAKYVYPAMFLENKKVVPTKKVVSKKKKQGGNKKKKKRKKKR